MKKYRNAVMAAVAAIAILVGGSTSARCDIGPGDLNDALTDFGSDLIQILEQMLLAGMDIPTVAPWLLNETMVGEHYSGLPTTPEASVQFAISRVEDRLARVGSLDSTVNDAVAQLWERLARVVMLEIANGTQPFSVAQLLQIQNAAALSSASADAAIIQHLGALLSIESDKAYVEESARITRMVQHEAWAGPITGGRIEAVEVDMPY